MTLQISDLLLDARNVKLLRLLRDDPRMSISALARRIGMSAPAVRERVQRLEEAGIIRGLPAGYRPAGAGLSHLGLRAGASHARQAQQDRRAG